MNNIIFVPFPMPEESPTSLLRRFAAHHGCEYTAQLSAITLPFNAELSVLSKDSRLVQWIADHAGQYAARFLEGFYQPIGPVKESRPHEITQTIVPSKLIKFRGAAICSECCREGYEHSIKDIKTNLFCPYHHRRYLYRCPRCSKTLYWMDAMHGKCTCKHELVSEPCSPEDCAPEKFVLQCLRNHDAETLANLSNLLTKMSNRQSFRADDPEDRLIFETAVSILNAEERGIKRYLNCLRIEHPELPARVIAAKLSLIKIPLVTKVMMDYCKDDDSPTYTPIETVKQPFLSLKPSEVRAATGLKRNNLRQVIKQLNLPWKKMVNSFHVSQDQFMPILEAIWEWKARNETIFKDNQSYVTRLQAIEILDIPLTVLKKLVRAGFFKIFNKPNLHLRIAAAEVNNFASEFESVTALAKRLNLDTFLTRQWLRKHRIQHLTIPGMHEHTIFYRAEINKAIANQNSTPEASYAKKRTDTLLLIPPEEHDNYYTTLQASKLVGVTNSNTLLEYVHAGLFSAMRSSRSTLLPKLEVQNFNKRYIFATECAVILNAQNKQISKLLILAGVRSVVNWHSDHCKTPLFYRSEVEALARVDAPYENDKMSISEAAALLRLPDATVMHLACSEALALDAKFSHKLWVSAKKANSFTRVYINSFRAAAWCNFPVRIVRTCLSRFGIEPVCGHTISGSNVAYYSAQDILDRGFKAPSSPTPHRRMLQSFPNTEAFPNLPSLEDIREILDTYKIQKTGFTNAFIRTGFVTPVTIGPRRYLTPSDAVKVRTILSHNYTPSMFNTLRGTNTSVYSLLQQGKLTLQTSLPPQLEGQLFITKESADNFTKSYTPRR